MAGAVGRNRIAGGHQLRLKGGPMKPAEHRPARLSGRVTRHHRGDVSKRSGHPRWIIRVDLQIDAWHWSEGDSDPASAPHAVVQLVASEGRWLRWLGRRPEVGDHLHCRLSYTGATTMEVQWAALSAAQA